jgi:hypothetical protein
MQELAVALCLCSRGSASFRPSPFRTAAQIHYGDEGPDLVLIFVASNEGLVGGSDAVRRRGMMKLALHDQLARRRFQMQNSLQPSGQKIISQAQPCGGWESVPQVFTDGQTTRPGRWSSNRPAIVYKELRHQRLGWTGLLVTPWIALSRSTQELSKRKGRTSRRSREDCVARSESNDGNSPLSIRNITTLSEEHVGFSTPSCYRLTAMSCTIVFDVSHLARD